MGAIQSIFFKPQRGIRPYIYDTDGSITGVEEILYQLDGVEVEQHSSELKLTRNPVEYGADLTDHAYRMPFKITVKGVVTNSPFLSQVGNNLPGGSSTGTIGSAFTGERIVEAYKGLIDIQNERQRLRLQTGLIDYDNMVLTKISTPNDITNKLDLTLTFEEAIIADEPQSDANYSVKVTSSPNATDVVTGLTMLAGLGITLAVASGS